MGQDFGPEILGLPCLRSKLERVEEVVMTQMGGTSSYLEASSLTGLLFDLAGIVKWNAYMWSLPVTWASFPYRDRSGQTFMVAHGSNSERKLPDGSFMAFDDLALEVT